MPANLDISKETLKRAVGVILRVPSLFIAEAWCRTNPMAMQQQYLGKDAAADRSQEILFRVVYYSGELWQPLSVVTKDCVLEWVHRFGVGASPRERS